jgi:hypothetical protein
LPGPAAPLGKYQITLGQGAARLTDSFELTAPPRPAGALFENCAWLAGLPGRQTVRLLAFGLVPPTALNEPGQTAGLAVWRFLSETHLLPDPAAGLLACPDAPGLALYPEFAYLAYPAGAGDAPVLLGDDDLLQEFQGVCANGPHTRLSVGKKARVTVKGLPLFSDPGLTTQPLALLNSGAAVNILSGPACPPQGPWIWLIKTSDNKTGWLTETDQLSYFLEPLP